MIINIDLEDTLVNKLEKIALESGKSKEYLVKEAVRSLVEEKLGNNLEEEGFKNESNNKKNSKWSEEFLNFNGVESEIDEEKRAYWLETINEFREMKEDLRFESYRDDLIPPSSEGVF